MKRIIDIIVDLKNKAYNTIFLKQLDTTIVKVKVLDNNIMADLKGQDVNIIFTKPNGTIVQQLSSDVDVENAIATIPLLPDCLRLNGKAKMEIEIKNTNSEVISSFYVPVQIEQTSKGNVTSDNTPNYFEEFAQGVDKLKENSEKIIKDLEEKRDSDYFKGDKGDKGDTGDSGVYIGENEPTAPEIRVWIDPNEGPTGLEGLEKELENVKNIDILQDKVIKDLQKENQILKNNISNLENQIPSGEEKGIEIYLTDSSDYRCSVKSKINSNVTICNKNIIDIQPFKIVGGTTTHQSKNFNYNLKAGSYVLQRKFQKSENSAKSAGMVQVSFDGIWNKNIDVNEEFGIIILEKDTKVSFQFKISTSFVSESESWIEYFDIQLEKGNLKSNFENHQEQVVQIPAGETVEAETYKNVTNFSSDNEITVNYKKDLETLLINGGSNV